MLAALGRHDALMRAALEARGGYIFKTVGDGFFAAFETAPDAVCAALDVQRTIASEDFSKVAGVLVRMALHTGRSAERDGDYFGPTVNRAARLLAIGHGGQVLVSGVTADLLQGELPAQCSLRDLGDYRLRDLLQPEHVYQLVAPDLPEAFPPLRSLDRLSNNLPAQLTSFVGREEVLAEIMALVGRHRLVTFVGTGGAGKTRCAVELGAELLDKFGDGVWMVELALITDPALVTNAIAQTLKLQEQPNRSMLETLIAFLKRKHLLLILDGCEHMIDEVRTVAAAILQNCADVTLLATSREALNIAGEQLYWLPALSVPPAGRSQRAQDIRAFGAPLLFVDRALSMDNRFTLSAENAPHIAEICRRLDGIPLAIELAAARVKVLAPKQLAQMLDERFRVLTGGDRSALPRHQTMRALMDWSFDLLPESERAVFRKLSVFNGSFTLESANEVCSGGSLDDIAQLNILSSLVDKSLVQVELGKSGKRYRLLETTRHYAHERLVESGEHESASHAHAAAFLTLAERLEDAWETMPDHAWLAEAEPELENFRAALEWSFAKRDDLQLALRLAGALRRVWSNLAAAEGRRWIREALDAADESTPSPVVAQLELTQAQLDGVLGLHKTSAEAATRAMVRYRQLNDSLHVADAQRWVGRAFVFLGRTSEAETFLNEALVGARASNARKLTVLILGSLAIERSTVGDFPGARSRYAEALAIARACGADGLVADNACNLAEAEFRSGDVEMALRLIKEALTPYRAHNQALGIVIALSNMAAYLLAHGEYVESRAHAREALSIAQATQRDVSVAIALGHLAAVAALRTAGGSGEREDRERAARVLGYVDARLSELETVREYTEQHGYEKTLAALHESLGAEDAAKRMKEGSNWSEDQAVAEALLI